MTKKYEPNRRYAGPADLVRRAEDTEYLPERTVSVEPRLAPTTLARIVTAEPPLPIVTRRPVDY